MASPLLVREREKKLISFEFGIAARRSQPMLVVF